MDAIASSSGVLYCSVLLPLPIELCSQFVLLQLSKLFTSPSSTTGTDLIVTSPRSEFSVLSLTHKAWILVICEPWTNTFTFVVASDAVVFCSYRGITSDVIQFVLWPSRILWSITAAYIRYNSSSSSGALNLHGRRKRSVAYAGDLTPKLFMWGYWCIPPPLEKPNT